jgi:hypothetical protein
LSTLEARRRQKNYRRRRRHGAAVLAVEVQFDALVEAMVSSGRLTPEQALSRHEVEQQVSAIVEDWRQRWAEFC